MKPGKTLQQFEQKHGTGRVKELQAVVDAIARQHRTVVLDVPTVNNSITFGLVGDSHYGSLYEAKDVAKALYRRFAAQGITTVFHAGDVLDGHKIYRGQEFELHALGWAKQRDWFTREAPLERGITTHFITGNHDASLKKIAGIDVGAELEHVRPDWVCLGEDIGTVTLRTPKGKTYTVMLLHPDGGTAYAISYRIQKIIEQLEGGRKPHFLGVGNFHKAEFLPSYRNIAGCQVGCLQWQTPFMVRKGLSAHVGGWIIRVTPGEFNHAVSAEFIAFYADPRGGR
ncbi:MAG TPA: hypothetical protein DCP69_09070 [Candidatus Omnitrophica bacterium]|nr:hypothetical protein [Candidatus Omnitrophota bacterium]